MTPDQILLRWFNYHLKAAGWHRKVNNFSKDVCDGENYTVLLNQLKPDQCSRAPLQTHDLRQRAEQVLRNAEAIGCRKYLTVPSLLSGNPRLNLAFVANLFNTHPGIEPLDEQEAKTRVLLKTLMLKANARHVYSLFGSTRSVSIPQSTISSRVSRMVLSFSKPSIRLFPVALSGVVSTSLRLRDLVSSLRLRARKKSMRRLRQLARR